MKRTAKRILPILLGIAIIASTIWYLFVYDVDFARDALLYQARFFDNQGNHSVASGLYKLAYRHSGGDPEVAIELAQQFKESGNYTKAEVTLSNAIADGGCAELYIALSKLYVEQDKLLDAVAMLDNITDENVRTQLSGLRPAAPTATPEDGYYNQYITVTVTAESGTLYLTSDGTYPSVSSAPSDGILTLTGGETVVYALAVSDNGLVSPLTVLGYTVSGVIEEVSIDDPAVNAAVRQLLGVAEDAVLYSNDLWSITQLQLPAGVQHFNDLAALPYLQSLTITGSTADGLEALASLSHLTELVITDSYVKTGDLLVIASLPNLQMLTLENCGISSIDNLSGAENLQYLDLSGNSIRDLSALSFMNNLLHLDLKGNALTTLNAISSLTSLQTLDVSYNSLESIAPIAGCTALQSLNLSDNFVTGLSGLAGLASLKTLNAAGNQLTDVSALANCTALQTLDLSGNSLTDISMLSTLNSLQEFSFARNQITMLPNWNKDCSLVSIDGSSNLLVTIGSLGGLENLNYVYMDYNQITSVDALASCHNLVKVSVYGNPITDVSALTDQSIIVNYNPLG